MEEGLREVIDDISPIEDYTGTLAVEFGEYAFDPPPVSIRECREKDLTYSAPLSVTVRFINKSPTASLIVRGKKVPRVCRCCYCCSWLAGLATLSTRRASSLPARSLTSPISSADVERVISA